MDVKNIDVKVPINATQIIELVAEIAANVTNTPNIINVAVNLKDDIKKITNLARLIDQTPIKDFTQRIAWDSIDRLLTALGLNTIISVPAIKATFEQIEETLEDPNALIADITGYNLEEIVDQQLKALPDVPDIKDLED